jgi:hypothetical protein
MRLAYIVIPDDNDPLRDMLLAEFGGYPSPDEIGVDYGDMFSKQLGAQRVGTAVLGPELAHAITPSVVSGWELKPFDQKAVFEGQQGIYLGSALSYDDVLTFWNLRATGMRLRFYDPSFDERLRWVRDSWLGPIIEQSQTGRLEDWAGVWAGTEQGLSNAPDLGRFSAYRVADRKFWETLKPIYHFHWNEERTLATLSLDPLPSYSFPFPQNPVGREASPLQNIGVTIRPEGDLGPSSRRTFWLPGLPSLNMYYSDHIHTMAPFSVRVSQDYFTMCVSVAQDTEVVPALEKNELIAKVFESAAMKVEPSLPGIVASRMIAQMGGLVGCRVFRFPGVRNLIEKYSPLQSFTRAGAITCIRDLDESHKSRLDRYLATGSKITAQQIFDGLLERRVFRPGLELSCPHCNLSFWVPLDSVQTDLECELCGNRFNCTPQLRDRDWRFRRSGLFGKDDHQEGGIPVALTLNQLFGMISGLGDRRIFCAAMKISSAGASVPDCETDLVLLSKDLHGHLEIVIGEAKSAGGEISDTDVSNLSAICEVFEVKGIRAFMVFSKTGQFTDDEVQRCKVAAGRFPNQVIMLSSRELEPPFFMYEWAAKEFEVQPTAVDLTSMGRNSDTIFFNPKRK